MDFNQAHNIINALSEGIDPVTGEVLSQQSIFNQPEVIRALYCARVSLDKTLQSLKRQANLPANSGLAWDEQEDAKLAEEFDAGMSLPELAKSHGRTRGAITARLEKLGKTPAQGAAFRTDF